MPRASTSLSTTKTSRAEISSIGRDPSAGSAKLMNHSNFRNVAAAFPSRRFLFRQFARDGAERIRACFGARHLRGLLDLGRVSALRQVSPRAISGIPSVFQSDLGIDPYGERLLSATEAVSEPPTLRAVRRDPQLEAAAVRKLDDLRAGKRALYREIGKGHVGTTVRRMCRVPTYVPTILLDASGSLRTRSDPWSGLNLLIFQMFRTNLDVLKRQNGAQERTRTFTACTAGT